MTSFVLWQRAEGLLVFLAGLALFANVDSGLAWWLALPLFFVPDLSFFGYLFGPKFGGMVYNSVHIYGFGAALVTIGMLVALPLLSALGALWLAHTGFDRVFGYGLKSEASFSETHLGKIGEAR